MSGARGQSLDSPVLDAENPWPGLAPFDEAQAEFFYGRQREVEDLFRRVRLNLLTVLYGQSGLGKTSLVRAALFPRLRTAGLLPVPIRLDYSEGAAPARDQIWQALGAALHEAAVPAPSIGEDQTLWEYFHHRSLEKGPVPVLVFDQFEELFTLGTERAGGSGFVRDCLVELAALIENRPPDRVEARFDREPKLVAQYDFDRQDYRVLLSLREDYLAHLHDLSGRIPSITLNNMRLTPLDGPRALEAVEKPGQLKRLIAPGAAEAIVRVVAGARGERPARAEVGFLEHTGEHRSGSSIAPLESLVIDPSLLSLLCRELNQKRQEEGLPAITPELVEANRENILNNFYARCLAGLPEGVQIFIEEDLLTESGFRETLSVDSAVGKLRRRGADAHALTTLVDRRLLHYEQRGTVTRVELTHDVLAPVVRHSRTLRREREAVHEAEARKRRELEENERIAQQARAEAETKYERSKRQRRLFAGIGIAMAAVAALAVNQTIKANRAAATVDSVNVSLKQQQTALEDSTRAAQAARARADAALARGDTALHVADSALRASSAMLKEFCSYALSVINRFGDSTAGNRDLSRAYNSLVELSDVSVERMVENSPIEVCPRQLDTRTEGVATGLRLVLGDTVGARLRGHRAMLAARYLTRHRDSLSRRVLNQTYHSLVPDLHWAGEDAAALQAAREGLPFAREVDPRRDSLAYYWHAWLYDFGAIALLALQRTREAKTWTDSGLAVVARGLRRSDQKQELLRYSESYLQLRRALIAMDTTIRDSSGVRIADSSAVAAARARFALINTVGSLEELAKMEGFLAEHARAQGRFAEAIRGADSSASHWAAILRQGRRVSDTTMIVDGLTGMVRALVVTSGARMSQGQHDPAVALARDAVDSARSLVQVRANPNNQTVLSSAWQTLGFRLERASRFAGSDSSYRTAVRLDSLRLERGSGSPHQLSVSLEDYLNDLSRVLTKRLQTDTAGRDSTSRLVLLRQSEERRRGPRETLVWLRRRTLSRLNTPAARDSLAVALGNLSWTYLLIDRPEQAADVAKEGISLSATQTYIIPNYFNAVLLSGNDETAETIFRQFAGRMVEADPVPFPCAVLRDIRQLLGRGVAMTRHASVVERLVASQGTECQTPPQQSRPRGRTRGRTPR